MTPTPTAQLGALECLDRARWILDRILRGHVDVADMNSAAADARDLVARAVVLLEQPARRTLGPYRKRDAQ